MAKKIIKEIETYIQKKGFTESETIIDTKKSTVIALGYFNAKNNHLIEFDKETKTINTLFVDGQSLFTQFVKKHKEILNNK